MTEAMRMDMQRVRREAKLRAEAEREANYRADQLILRIRKCPTAAAVALALAEGIGNDALTREVKGRLEEVK